MPDSVGQQLQSAAVIIDGRKAITRAGMVAAGIGLSTAEGLYRNRHKTGHPEKAGRHSGQDYWWLDEWLGWRASYHAAKRAALTAIDTSGEASDLVDAAGAAAIMGYANAAVINANSRKGLFALPDREDPLPAGRGTKRWWRRSTVWAFAGTRTGPGGGHPLGAPGAPRKAHPYAGDARLALVAEWLQHGDQLTGPAIQARLAEIPGLPATSSDVARRILRTALDLAT